MLANNRRHLARSITLVFSSVLIQPPQAATVTPQSFLAPSSESYTFVKSFGSNGNLNDEFAAPEGVAVDPAGNIWVADRDNHRIAKFDPNGNFLFNFGGPGAGDGLFNSPQDIAIDRAGNIWVADRNNNRVQKFDASGKFLCKSAGLNGPRGIGTSRTGTTVFVANTNSNGIVKLSLACVNAGGWGGLGSGDGEFNFPADVAVGPNGNVYVTDYNNHRVQIFRPTGAFVAKFGTSGSGDSRYGGVKFSGPVNLEFDACGGLFVADHLNARIQLFTADGRFVTTWGWGGAGAGQFRNPTAVAPDARGRLIVADRDNHRIQIFQPSTNDLTFSFQSEIGTPGVAGALENQLNNPQGITTDKSNGEIYVADTSNQRIQVFDKAGNPLRRWGSGGSSHGQFSTPRALAVHSGTHEVYVVDRFNHRVEVFSSTGVWQRQIGTGLGNSNAQFNEPVAIALDETGNQLWVADGRNARIQKFDATSGAFLMGVGNGGVWTAPTPAPVPAAGSLNRQFDWPHGLAVNQSTGEVYVVEYNNRRVQKLSKSGGFLTKWGVAGSGKGQFINPLGAALDNGGNVFVVDQGNQRIQKFAPTGRFMTAWGSLSCPPAPPAGSLEGLFCNPDGIAVDASTARVLVADQSNHRIQAFKFFGFTLAVTPALRTIVQDAVAKYTATATKAGVNSARAAVNMCLLSGKPGDATTVTFSRNPVTATGSSAMSVDTRPTTAARTYTLYVQARGGGQTRIKRVTMKVTRPPTP